MISLLQTKTDIHNLKVDKAVMHKKSNYLNCFHRNGLKGTSEQNTAHIGCFFARNRQMPRH